MVERSGNDDVIALRLFGSVLFGWALSPALLLSLVCLALQTEPFFGKPDEPASGVQRTERRIKATRATVQTVYIYI